MKCPDNTSSALMTNALLHVAHAAILSHEGTEVNWQTGRRGNLCHRVLSIAPHLERAVRLPAKISPARIPIRCDGQRSIAWWFHRCLFTCRPCSAIERIPLNTARFLWFSNAALSPNGAAPLRLQLPPRGHFGATGAHPAVLRGQHTECNDTGSSVRPQEAG